MHSPKLSLQFGSLPSAGAAPHLPAGVLSRIVTGRGGALADVFANLLRCGISATPQLLFLPVTIRGEMPGRAMRGSVSFGDSSPGS
ncbi:hypothetical protein FJ938_02665 [Mesorhizobium sp. B2-4-14]|nr:hypothetical protein FJ938_02665 [Mesorhizobium sp. B2-4-14]